MRELTEAERTTLIQYADQLANEVVEFQGPKGYATAFELGFTAALTHIQSTLIEIIAQLESCGYQCEAGALENNVEFKRLKEMVK